MLNFPIAVTKGGVDTLKDTEFEVLSPVFDFTTSVASPSAIAIDLNVRMVFLPSVLKLISLIDMTSVFDTSITTLSAVKSFGFSSTLNSVLSPTSNSYSVVLKLAIDVTLLLTSSEVEEVLLLPLVPASIFPEIPAISVKEQNAAATQIMTNVVFAIPDCLPNRFDACFGDFDRTINITPKMTKKNVIPSIIAPTPIAIKAYIAANTKHTTAHIFIPLRGRLLVSGLE